MMYHLLIERPLQSFAGLAIMLDGLAIYAFSQSRLGHGKEFDRISHD